MEPLVFLSALKLEALAILLAAPEPEPELQFDIDRLTSTVVLMSLLSLFLIPQITAYFRAFMQSSEPNLELNK